MRLISCYETGGWGITTTDGYIRTSAYDSGYGYRNASSTVTYSSLGTNSWHMFTMTFDGVYWKIYLDGNLIATSPAFTSGKISYNSTNTIFVGAEAGGSATTPVGQYFKGIIKNVEIKNACVNASGVKQLYQSGTYKMWFKFEPIRWRVSDYGVDKNMDFIATGSSFYTVDRSYMYTNLMTMNVWAYTDDWSAYAKNGMRIISCTEGGGWNIESAQSLKYVEFAIYDSGVGYKSIVTSKEWASISAGWHMFTLTFDGTYARGYLDGDLIGTSVAFTSGKIGYHSSNAIFVGAEAGASSTTPVGSYFKGKISNLSITNACSSATSIKQLYQSGRYNVNLSDYTSLSYFQNYLSYAQNFVAVSDLILSVGAMNDTRATMEGTSVADMMGFQIVEGTLDSLNVGDYFKYYKSGNVIKVDSYATYTQGNTTSTSQIAYSSPLRIVSTEELDAVGLANKQARASDMVAFILGVDKNNASYWTRDLSNLGAGVAITASGSQIRPWLDQVMGMRFAYTFSEGSNVSYYS